MGTYDAKNPIICRIRDDKRYRSWRSEPLPQSNAVIIYMMSVGPRWARAEGESSGSRASG